jgi:hypothetical protein
MTVAVLDVLAPVLGVVGLGLNLDTFKRVTYADLVAEHRFR